MNGRPATSDPAGVRIVERTTARTARYAVAGAPLESARRVWFALHGYGQLAERFLRPFAGVVPHDTAVVAPEGLSRFYLEAPRADGAHLQRVGATWLTRESRETEIRDALAWLELVRAETQGASRGPVSYGVLAFSQGVATAMRWIGATEFHPRAFVAWAGGVATDVQENTFRERVAQARLVVVSGEHDRLVTGDARQRMIDGMRALHPAVEEIRFDGDHALHPPTLARLLTELPDPE